MSERVLVLYFVPNDGDDPSTPNCFFLSRPKGAPPLTLRDIRDSFPLPGSYHFRLRVDPRQLSATAAPTQQREEKSRHVWLDLPQDTRPLPSNGPVIYLKAVRISWSGEATSGAAAAAAAAAGAAAAAAAAAPVAAAAAPASSSSSSSSSSNGKVIVGDYWDSPEQKKETVPSVSGVSAAPSHHGDMLLFDEAPPAAPGGSKRSHDGIDLML